MKPSDLLPPAAGRVPSGIDRRDFLRIAAAGLGVSGLLSACGVKLPSPGPTATAGGSAAASKLQLPSHLPIQGPQPDFPATDAGLLAAYLTYPKNLIKSVSQPPGKGGPVSAVTTSHRAEATPLDQNAAWQEVNKQLNATLNVQKVATGDYAAKMGTLVAGNDFPDLFFWDSIRLVDAMTFVKAAYADLTPYVAGDAIKDYPNLAVFPPSAWAQAVFDGGIYGVPLTRPYVNYVWFINQTRFDEIGAGQPKNADDFKRILTELTRPQSNQYALLAPPPAFGLQFSGRGDVPQLAMFDVPNNWSVDNNGKFTKDIETEQFKEALSFVHDLYALGVFFPDVTGNASDNLLSGRAAILATSGWQSYAAYWDSAAQMNPPVQIRTLHPISHNGGQPRWHRFNAELGITPIKKGTPDRIKELLGILNYLAAPFGSQEALLLEYGVQGSDFNFDANGNPVVTAKGQGDLGVEWNYVMQRPQVLYDSNDPNFARVTYADLQTIIPCLVDDPSLGLYSATNQQKNGQLTQRFIDGLGELVTGRAPLSNLDQMLADWRSGGGDQIRQDYEQAYAQANKGS
jgi:putative aldouronate transport system substrate-binding protein